MKLFKIKKKAKKDIFENGDFNIKDESVLAPAKEFLVALMYASPFVGTIYPACASCYNISENKNTEYDQQVAYIGRRVKTQHTSILEHSNIVLQIYIPLLDGIDILSSAKYDNEDISDELLDINYSNQSIIEMISEVRDQCHYLYINTDIRYTKDDKPMLRLTIGGSIRGYRYIFENIKNRQNRLFISIFNILTRVIEPEFFIDYINSGYIRDYMPIDIYDDLFKHVKYYKGNYSSGDKIDILNVDDIDHISKLLKLRKEDCFDFVSITVDFKKMSRIITQQLTRHRNAITQESQRYVSYKDTKVNNPENFKDKYEKDKIYKTPIGDLTFEELGELMVSVYGSLIEQGVDKEDARGYLPENVQSGKTFMTFTLRTLLSFLHLRLDSHAQAEIREYANILADSLDIPLKFGNDIREHADIYVRPRYEREYVYELEIDEEV